MLVGSRTLNAQTTSAGIPNARHQHTKAVVPLLVLLSRFATRLSIKSTKFKMIAVATSRQLTVRRITAARPNVTHVGNGKMHYFHSKVFDERLANLLFKLRAEKEAQKGDDGVANEASQAGIKQEPTNNSSDSINDRKDSIHERSDAFKLRSDPVKVETSIPTETIYVPPPSSEPVPKNKDHDAFDEQPKNLPDSFWASEEPMASILAAQKSKDKENSKPTENPKDSLAAARRQAIKEAVEEAEDKLKWTTVPPPRKPVITKYQRKSVQSEPAAPKTDTMIQNPPPSVDPLEEYNRIEGVKSRFMLELKERLEENEEYGYFDRRSQHEGNVVACVRGEFRDYFLSVLTATAAAPPDFEAMFKAVEASFLAKDTARVEKTLIEYPEIPQMHQLSSKKRVHYLASEKFPGGIDGIAKARQAGFTVMTLIGREVVTIGHSHN